MPKVMMAFITMYVNDIMLMTHDKFSGYVQDYNEKDSKTHSGMVDNTIAIMSHPIPNTNDPRSVHVIISQKQLAHKSDM